MLLDGDGAASHTLPRQPNKPRGRNCHTPLSNIARSSASQSLPAAHADTRRMSLARSQLLIVNTSDPPPICPPPSSHPKRADAQKGHGASSKHSTQHRRYGASSKRLASAAQRVGARSQEKQALGITSENAASAFSESHHFFHLRACAVSFRDPLLLASQTSLMHRAAGQGSYVGGGEKERKGGTRTWGGRIADSWLLRRRCREGSPKALWRASSNLHA